MRLVWLGWSTSSRRWDRDVEGAVVEGGGSCDDGGEIAVDVDGGEVAVEGAVEGGEVAVEGEAVAVEGGEDAI